jgi:hypothetical protein
MSRTALLAGAVADCSLQAGRCAAQVTETGGLRVRATLSDAVECAAACRRAQQRALVLDCRVTLCASAGRARALSRPLPSRPDLCAGTRPPRALPAGCCPSRRPLRPRAPMRPRTRAPARPRPAPHRHCAARCRCLPWRLQRGASPSALAQAPASAACVCPCLTLPLDTPSRLWPRSIGHIIVPHGAPALEASAWLLRQAECQRHEC